MLVNAKLFCSHFGNYHLSGDIPTAIFSPIMTLVHGRSGIMLDWMRRLRVSLKTAKVFNIFTSVQILQKYRDVNNVLLDKQLNAEVVDFGVSKLVSDTGQGHVITQVKGTTGYLDLEYYLTQQATTKRKR